MKYSFPQIEQFTLPMVIIHYYPKLTQMSIHNFKANLQPIVVRVRGIGPPASRTPYERSTDELHPETCCSLPPILVGYKI